MMYPGYGSIGMSMAALFGLALTLGGIAMFVLSVIVLIKLNKALNIWLEMHRRDLD